MRDDSINDLIATIAKLDSNGVQVLPEGRTKTTSPQVHSSTDLSNTQEGESRNALRIFMACCMRIGCAVCAFVALKINWFSKFEAYIEGNKAIQKLYTSGLLSKLVFNFAKFLSINDLCLIS